MRKARVYIYEIRICCPFCDDPVLTEEGNHPGECVGIEPGERECANEDCRRRFTVPDTSSIFSRPLRIRGHA